MKAIRTLYGASLFRSRTEARWAIFFDACGIAYDYEHQGFHLSTGAYLPDFWLPGFQLFVEIKGSEPSPEEQEKCAELARVSGRVVLLAQGAPEERFQIRWIDGEGDDDRLYVIARDRHADAGFWLVADDAGDSSRWFGGGAPGVTLRGGPMFSPIEAAYRAAATASFDHGNRMARVQPL